MSEDFDSTIRRVRSVEQARAERREDRRGWMRRKEDNLELLRAERAERRKELRAWIILVVSIFAIVMGNLDSIGMALQAF